MKKNQRKGKHVHSFFIYAKVDSFSTLQYSELLMIVTFLVLKVAQWLLSSWKQILLWTENFEVFLTGNKVSYTSKSPNSSNTYAIKVECLQTIFCVIKAWRKWKKEKLGGQKPVLKQNEMDYKQFSYFNF